MNDITIKPSTRKGKKWEARLQDGTHVHFGAAGYEDFTQHKDPARQKRYLARHKNDPTSKDTPGFWARELLWSKPSMQEAVKHVEKKLNVNIKMKR